MPKRRLARKRKKGADALVELGAMSKRLNRHLSDSDGMNSLEDKKPIKTEPEDDIKPLLRVKKEPKRAVRVKSEPKDVKPKIRPKRETKPTLKAKPEEMSPVDDMSGPSFMDMSTANLTPKDLKVIQLKKELVEKIVELSQYLPNNSLDELVDGLGGKSQVAEVGISVVMGVIFGTFCCQGIFGIFC